MFVQLHLPSAASLLSHHVPTDGVCPLCKVHFATTPHCLFFCDAPRKIWKRSIYWQRLKSLRMVGFIDCGLFILESYSLEEFEIFVMMAWAVWQEVCKRVYDNSHQVMEFNIDWVYPFLESFRIASLRGEFIDSEVRPRIDMAWRPPNPGHLRLDIDACFDSLNENYSVGAVVRDNHGLVRGAKASVIRNPGSVKGAELVAIRFGMDFCLRQGFTKVGIFSDSSQAVQAVTCSLEDIGTDSPIALEIKSFLASHHFDSIYSMRRTANRAAHQLAKEALKSSGSLEWLHDCIPNWLLNIVKLDFSYH